MIFYLFFCDISVVEVSILGCDENVQQICNVKSG